MMYSHSTPAIILDNETLSKQDIVMMKTADDNVECLPSKFYKNKTGIADNPVAMWTIFGLNLQLVFLIVWLREAK